MSTKNVLTATKCANNNKKRLTNVLTRLIFVLTTTKHSTNRTKGSEQKSDRKGKADYRKLCSCYSKVI